MADNRFKLARTTYNKHGRQTIEEVVKNGGFSHSMIDDLESNLKKKRGTNYITVAELATYYGVSTDFLSGLSSVPTTDKDLSFICDYTGLSQDTVEALHNWGKYKSAGSNYKSSEVAAYTLPNFLDCMIKNNIMLLLTIEANIKGAIALDSSISKNEFQEVMPFWLSSRGKEVEDELKRHNLVAVTISAQRENCVLAAINYFRKAVDQYINDKSAELKEKESEGGQDNG